MYGNFIEATNAITTKPKRDCSQRYIEINKVSP